MAELTLLGVPDGHGEPPAEAVRNLTQRIGKLAVKVGIGIGNTVKSCDGFCDDIRSVPLSIHLNKSMFISEEHVRCKGRQVIECWAGGVAEGVQLQCDHEFTDSA